MAQQTTVKRAVKSVDMQPEKPAKPAAKSGRTFDYSKYRQSFRNDRDFAAYLAGYPNKTGILAYVYRLRPAIDMSLIGISENSILKTSNPAEMCQEFVASRFGRGKYLLKLSDANRPRGENEACRTWFEVDDPDLTPIYDPRTLKLGELENQDEIARLLQAGILVRDTSGAPRFRTQADTEIAASAGASPSNGHSGAADLLSRDVLSQVLLKVVTQGSQAPADMFRQAVDMAKLMQGSQQPAMDVNQVAELVAAKLSRTTTTEDGAGGFIKSLEQWEGVIQRIRGPVVAPVDSKASPGLAMASQVLGFIDGLIPKVFMGLQQLQQLRQTARPGKRVMGQQPNGQQNGGQQVPQQMTVQERIAQIAITGFERMQAGVNGHDFAAYICYNVQGGLEIFQMLEGMGVAGVMGMCAMDSRTAPFLTDADKRAQVEAFLSEFFSFDSDSVELGPAVDPGAAGSPA